MRHPEIEMIKVTDLKFTRGYTNRWLKWANSIANRLRRSSSRIFPIELLFLKRSHRFIGASQKWAYMPRLINLSMPLILKPILTYISRHFVNKNLKSFGTFSNNQNLKEGFGSAEQGHRRILKHKKAQYKTARNKAFIDHSSRPPAFLSLKRIENSAISSKPDTINKKPEFLQIPQKWKRKETGSLSYYGTDQHPLLSPVNDSQQENSENALTNQARPTDGSRFARKEDLILDRYPPTVYRRTALSNIEDNKPTQPPVQPPSTRAGGSIQRTELSPTINVEQITEEVIRKIDHKLHVWRERTGRV